LVFEDEKSFNIQSQIFMLSLRSACAGFATNRARIFSIFSMIASGISNSLDIIPNLEDIALRLVTSLEHTAPTRGAVVKKTARKERKSCCQSHPLSHAQNALSPPKGNKPNEYIKS
jgi:hypothetical protein